MVASPRAAVALGLLAACGLLGCPSGESRLIPPAPTAGATPVIAQALFFVAEARDPSLDTSGGCVSAYEVGTDGLLAASPFASAAVVNPRRLIKHPVLPVLYVAGANQIFAYDISRAALRRPGTTGCRTGETQLALLGCPGGGLGAPCATDPRPGANPFDMTIAANDAGEYFLYVSEAGNGQNLDTDTRLAAYPLGPDGDLPATASSQVQDDTSLRYESSAPLPSLGFVYISDTAASVINRYILEADGNLPQPPTSPTPIGTTPTPIPSPTPVGEASPTPSPSPSPVRAFGPGRMQSVYIPACPTPSPGAGQPMIYVVEQRQNRIGVYPVSTPAPSPEPPATPLPFGDIPLNPTTESNTRGFYNAILIDPCATHIYGAAFNNGQIDFYELATDGNILDDTEGSTFPDTSQYPTGLAWLEYTPAGGDLQRSVLVSLGGSNRVDAYAVAPDGSIPERPFSSTEPIDGTFPADVLVYLLR
jgi:hypothetical protein